MFKFLDIVNLIRVRQWYKNLVVFLALIFSGNLFNQDYFIMIFLAFVSLCLISSSYYVINDLVDLKKDKHHSEKRLRPLASGKISKLTAYILTIVLLSSSLILAFGLNKLFFYSIITLFILSQLYTFKLKNILFADVLAISLLFVIRALSGAYVINVEVSPWLILCPFFLALFLAIGKRHADLLLLKNSASETRMVLKSYTLELTNSLMIISTTLLVMSYALYSFLSNFNYLIYTIPFALFVIFKYFFLVTSGSGIARNPDKVIKDKEMIFGIFLWVLVTYLTLYYI